MAAASEVPIRWGILATGWIAQTFTKDLVLTGRDVRAVGSRTLESAQAFADEFGIPNAYGSYEELAADPDVDIVYVSTPHAFHAENAILLLNAGKHVLVEKPFTLNAAQAREIVDLAASKGLLVLEAMWTRFLPHIVRIREIIAAGTLGELRQFDADHRQKAPTDPQHRMNALELGGGALLDLGIYPISFAAHLFGTPGVGSGGRAVSGWRGRLAGRDALPLCRRPACHLDLRTRHARSQRRLDRRDGRAHRHRRRLVLADDVPCAEQRRRGDRVV